MVNAAGAPMFFAGLILLIPHRIGMSRVNYVIKRYHLPISRAGLLLYKFHNPIELSLLFGCVLGAIIIIPIGLTGTDDGDPDPNPTGANHNNPTHMKIFVGNPVSGQEKNHRDAILFLMFTALFLMLLTSIILLCIYVGGGDYGHLNAFYLTLIFLTFFDGFTNAFAFAINGINASLYALGVPLSGFLLSILHNIYKFFSDFFHWDDFDYHILRLQLICNILHLIIALVLWIGLSGWTFRVKSTEQNETAMSAQDVSPILLLAFSLGTVYAFYPSIAPYSIIDFQYASVIELWILCVSVIPTITMAALDIGGSGPGKVNNSSTSPWSEGWHYVWICAIPYILCIQIFMSMLHYPHSLLSCFFNNKPLRIGFISVLFSTLREAMQVCGFAGAGKQSGQATSVNGILAAINKPITLFVMMFCVFTGDGYLQHYRRCCRDNWPTTGYNKYQSFFYWLRYGFKGGIKSFITSFTDIYYHDIRPQIISYA